MDSTPRFGLAVDYVTDIQAAKRFYVETMGLAVEREAPTFVQFRDAGGSMFAIASDEPVGGRAETELYWLVDDAEAAYRRLAPMAQVSLPLKELPFGKVFAIQDPAGHPRYLLELAQARPSQAVS